MSASTIGTGRGARVGVALSQTSICAAIRAPGDTRVKAWRASIAPLNGDGAGWTPLVDALRALARDAGVTDGRLSVALLPPLAEARSVHLPPLAPRERNQLLARSAAKYFAAARGAQVVGAVAVPRGGGVTATVAAAAPTRLLTAIYDAARQAGWTIDSVVPAEAAWAAAAHDWAARGKDGAQLLVAHTDRTDLLRVVDARLVALRRFRAGAADAALIAEAAASGPRGVSIVGSPEPRRALAHGLSSHGISADTPVSAVSELAEQPDLLAAAFAGPGAEPRLVPESVRAGRIERARQFARRGAIAAAVLVLIAGVVEYVGVRRELASVRAQREELRPLLATTLVGRSSIETAYGQLAALAAAQRTAPRWSTVFAGISEYLPLEAYLTGFRGRGDSIAIDGHAVQAARVFEAIDRVPVLTGVRFSAPVRLEYPSDGEPMERFTISARLAGAEPLKPAPGRAGVRR